MYTLTQPWIWPPVRNVPIPDPVPIDWDPLYGDPNAQPSENTQESELVTLTITPISGGTIAAQLPGAITLGDTYGNTTYALFLACRSDDTTDTWGYPRARLYYTISSSGSAWSSLQELDLGKQLNVLSRIAAVRDPNDGDVPVALFWWSPISNKIPNLQIGQSPLIYLQQAPLSSGQQISAVINPDSRIEIFFVGTDNNIYHAWQQTSGGWSDCSLLASIKATSVTAIEMKTSKFADLTVFFASQDDQLYRMYRTSSNVWSTPTVIGGAGSGNLLVGYKSQNGGFRSAVAFTW